MAELTNARLKILREAERVGVVAALKQRQRTTERMARDGLLIKAGRGRDYQLTDKGRSTLAAVDRRAVELAKHFRAKQ